MSGPTHEDAIVMIEMMKISNTPEAGNAGRFVWGDDFIQEYDQFVAKYPRGSVEYGYVSQMCAWFEAIGALWKNGLLHEELIDDWIYVPSNWERVKGFALGLRGESGIESIYEHFEALAEAQSS